MSEDDTPKPGRAFEFLASQPWAILEENLEIIATIAQRLHDNEPEAVAAKLGRPLKNTRLVTMRGSTAVIPVIGPVFRYANWMTEISGATSIQILSQDFNKALEDPAVEAIVLEVDSPGGTVAGVAEFADMVYEARGKKPVVAYVSDLGASAAYWIACAADRVVVASTAKVGSIGAIIQYDKRGEGNTGRIISSQSPYKAADPTTDEGRAQYQKLVDSQAEVFVATVARNRGVTPEKVLADFGQGGLFVGAQAVSAGLADRVGSLEGVLAELQSPKTVSTKGGKTKMSGENQPQAITRDFILANHPQIAESFRTEGFEKGKTEGLAQGAKAELDRIKAVQALEMPGHEALIAELAFDGKTTPEQAAVKLVHAEKVLRDRALTDRREDAPKPLSPTREPEATSTPAVPAKPPTLEEQAKAEWEKDPQLQAEHDLESYIAWKKVDAAEGFSKHGKK